MVSLGFLLSFSPPATNTDTALETPEPSLDRPSPDTCHEKNKLMFHVKHSAILDGSFFFQNLLSKIGVSPLAEASTLLDRDKRQPEILEEKK